VPGVVVAVELVLLAELGEQLVQLVDLGRRRVLVVVAEQAEQRGAQVRQPLAQRRHAQRELGRRVAEHEGAVAVDRGVDVQLAAGEHGLPAAGAVPDRRHPGRAVRQRAQVRDRRRRRRRAVRRRPLPPRARAIAAASSGSAPGRAGG
jgi:hypothetical protein